MSIISGFDENAKGIGVGEMKLGVLYHSNTPNYGKTIYVKLGDDLLFLEYPTNVFRRVTRNTSKEFVEAPAGTYVTIKNP